MAFVSALPCQNHQFALNKQQKKVETVGKLPDIRPDVVQFAGKPQQDNDWEERLLLAEAILARPDMEPYVENFFEILNGFLPGFVTPLMSYAKLAGSRPEFIAALPQKFTILSQLLAPAGEEALVEAVAKSFSLEELDQLLAGDRFTLYQRLEEKQVPAKALQHPEFINTLAEITARCLPTSFQFRTAKLKTARA